MYDEYLPVRKITFYIIPITLFSIIILNIVLFVTNKEERERKQRSSNILVSHYYTKHVMWNLLITEVHDLERVR